MPAVIGFLIASGGKDNASSLQTPTAAASNKSVEMLFPPDWKRLASAPSTPGVKLEEPVAYGPADGDGSEAVTFGRVTEGANNFTLLSPDLLAAAGFSPTKVPKPKTVKLSRGGVQAYEYENLPVKGAGRRTLFAVPTSAGVATVVCSVPAPDCEAIANTLKLRDGEALPVGPSKAFADAVSTSLASVAKASQTGRSQLKSAKTNKSQAPVASKVSAAYGDAAKSLEQLDGQPGRRLAQGARARPAAGGPAGLEEALDGGLQARQPGLQGRGAGHRDRREGPAGRGPRAGGRRLLRRLSRRTPRGRGELRAVNVKNATEAAAGLRESGHMELHRLAIVLMAVVLAFSLAFAAGQIASSEQRGAKLQPPAGDARRRSAGAPSRRGHARPRRVGVPRSGRRARR